MFILQLNQTYGIGGDASTTQPTTWESVTGWRRDTKQIFTPPFHIIGFAPPARLTLYLNKITVCGVFGAAQQTIPWHDGYI